MVHSKDGLPYVYVPAGTFRMGCAHPTDEPCRDQEKPAHDVRISKGFWMGQTEVTVAAYKRYVQAAGKAMPAEPEIFGRKLNPQWSLESLPMTDVDWNDARDYCEGNGLRLPTEAEWEYAARAGISSEYFQRHPRFLLPFTGPLRLRAHSTLPVLSGRDAWPNRG